MKYDDSLHIWVDVSCDEEAMIVSVRALLINTDTKQVVNCMTSRAGADILRCVDYIERCNEPDASWRAYRERKEASERN